jgi:hypothetical protein
MKLGNVDLMNCTEGCNTICSFVDVILCSVGRHYWSWIFCSAAVISIRSTKNKGEYSRTCNVNNLILNGVNRTVSVARHSIHKRERVLTKVRKRDTANNTSQSSGSRKITGSDEKTATDSWHAW